MCPNCGRLPIRDYNAFPQHMWERDVQNWHCENCNAALTRQFLPTRQWTPWVLAKVRPLDAGREAKT